MKECKFQRVKQMTIDLKQLARPLAKREDKTTVDAEFEHQAEHCTFQP
jgi:uncharacterized ParB-like nuclease family protein